MQTKHFKRHAGKVAVEPEPILSYSNAMIECDPAISVASSLHAAEVVTPHANCPNVCSFPGLAATL